MEASSLSGLFTRVLIGQIFICSDGNGTSKSRGSGSRYHRQPAAGRPAWVALVFSRLGMLADDPEILAGRTIEAHQSLGSFDATVAVTFDNHKAES